MEEMEVRKFEHPFDIVQMFKTKEDLKTLFKNIFLSCFQINEDNPDEEFLPLIYDSKRESFNVSYNFFIDIIAKSFDPGEKEPELKIAHAFKLSNDFFSLSKEEIARGNKIRKFLIVDILQEIYGVVYPNNPKINAKNLNGYVNYKFSYFLPCVYENRNKKSIQYDMVPFKKKNILDLGVNENIIDKVIELIEKKGLKQVAFNASGCKKYWIDCEQKMLRYE